MKALAAASIGQYEKSVVALDDYYRTVELGLGACVRNRDRQAPGPDLLRPKDEGGLAAVVFGSDQGLVGQFNDVVADFAIRNLADLPGQPIVWAVGERVQAQLADAGLNVAEILGVPNSVEAITGLVGQIQRETAGGKFARIYVFHNRPKTAALYEPVAQRLLPLDTQWEQGLSKVTWPTCNLPEVMGTGSSTLRALVREYLFISLFRACAESLASENSSRLAAMERADKSIADLLESLHSTFERMRQSAIDEELFDVISGFEALSHRPGGGL
jgi:F-type H+-transporting ATPase subunit gamma